MWKRIQKRFQRKQVEKQEPPRHRPARRLSRRKIDTKVTYKYPRQTPFRFPVIPDDKERENIDRPTYKRRQERVGERIRVPRKKPTGKMPFSPTEVPSPIYGYQRRRIADELENIPAFERQNRKRKVDEQPLSEQVEQDKQEQIHHQFHGKVITQDQPLHKTRNMSENNPKKDNQNRGNQTRAYAKDKTTETKSKVVHLVDDHSLKKPKRHVKSPHDSKVEQTPFITDEIPLYLLNDPIKKNREDQRWMTEQQTLLEDTLNHFNVPAKVVHSTQGPTVTRFEVQPELGVKVSRVRNLSDDIKMNLSAKDIRIEAPIPGKNTIGIEVPNLNAQMVGLQEIFQTDAFQKSSSSLTIGLGLSIEGKPHITTIDKMPHGLIAGATGSGKSVCINTILISLLYKASHEEVKLLLIDPKMVELAPYNNIPHLVSPVITDIKTATAALKWAVGEMEERYEQFVQAGVRDIHRYNEKMGTQEQAKMPHIVIIIDELADLMMASPQDVEDAICRIAQKARACGMHLILATQRPSVDVITGLIKANIPTRIAFSVSSQVDSRTIMDTNGAERLLGKGDMLFIENGSGKSVRLQGAFVSDDEIERVTNHVKSLAKPNYLFHQDQLIEHIEADEEVDELYEDVIQFILEHDQASTSLLQRHFRIGYNRAARLIDTLESKGMISEQNGSKPREVLFTLDQLEEYI